jgi:hypothetical protein
LTPNCVASQLLLHCSYIKEDQEEKNFDFVQVFCLRSHPFKLSFGLARRGILHVLKHIVSHIFVINVTAEMAVVIFSRSEPSVLGFYLALHPVIFSFRRSSSHQNSSIFFRVASFVSA